MKIKTVHEYKAAPDLLKDKVILVTGAGNGIGKEASITFAKHGATVIFLARTVENWRLFMTRLSAGYPQPAIIPLDLKGATPSHYRDMAATIQEQFGQLDGVLHNAGLLGFYRRLLTLKKTAGMTLCRSM